TFQRGSAWVESSTASVASAAVAAGTLATASPDRDTDSGSDRDVDGFCDGADESPGAPRLDRMRLDLIRDPDFVEALAKNSLRSPRTAPGARHDAAGTAWVPQWFEETDDPESPSGRLWAYKGGYWAARAQRAFPPLISLWHADQGGEAS
ncbi:hypothetical protein IWQ57_004159, partial [Coemansia nantahalensis]